MNFKLVLQLLSCMKKMVKKWNQWKMLIFLYLLELYFDLIGELLLTQTAEAAGLSDHLTDVDVNFMGQGCGLLILR